MVPSARVRVRLEQALRHLRVVDEGVVRVLVDLTPRRGLLPSRQPSTRNPPGFPSDDPLQMHRCVLFDSNTTAQRRTSTNGGSKNNEKCSETLCT